MFDVKIIIGWDKSELGKERELANTVYNPHKSSVAAYQCFSFINLKMANEKG